MYYPRVIVVFFFFVLTPFFALNSSETNELASNNQEVTLVPELAQKEVEPQSQQDQPLVALAKPSLKAIDSQDFIASLQESAHQEDEKNSEYLERLLETSLDCLSKIEIDLEKMGLIISNNQAKVKNKNNIINEIMLLRSKIAQKKQDTLLGADRKQLSELTDFIMAVVTHIRYLLTTDLVNFKPFVIRSSKSNSPLYSYKELEEKIKKNNQLVAALDNESENIGLSILNRLFRKVERFNNDYKVSRILTISTGVAVALSWLAYRIDADYFIKAKRFLGFSKKAKIKKETLALSPLGKLLAEDSSSAQQFTPQTLKNFSQQSNSPQVDEQALQQIAAASYALGIDPRNRPSLNSDYKDVPAFKKVLGSPLNKYDLTHGVSPDDPRLGAWTRIENFFQHNLGIISFTPVPFVLYELLKPTMVEWAEQGYDWFKNKRARFASFLRGGAIQGYAGMFIEKVIKYSFDNVIGNEHIKTVLGALVHYLVNTEACDRAGLVPPTGILLVGDPRTGKSFIAEALAGEVKQAFLEKGITDDFKFIPLTVADLKNKKFGGIMNILMSLRELAPVIVFIDELDTGGFQRERDSQALSELQLAMSKLNEDKSKKVIILAATNKPENLDFSLIKPGRFEMVLQLSLPTLNERKEFITRELTKRAVFIDEEYIDIIAHETESSTYDALNRLIITAMQKAKMNNSVLTSKELDEALNETIYKIIFDEDTLPETELFTIAAHQAGHAFLRLHLNPSLQLTKVTIRPTIGKINEESVWGKYNKDNQEGASIVEHGKVFTAHNAESLKYETSQDLINELMISLAGHSAEKILLEGVSSNYHIDDNKQALSLAQQIVFAGVSKKDIPKKVKEQKLEEAYELVKLYEQKVTEILTENKQALILITNFLSEYKILSAAEIKWILKKLDKTLKKESKKTNELTEEIISTPEIATITAATAA